jgi:hypothetical protein
MGLRHLKFTRTARRRALVDDAVAAYADWLSECVAVRNAYHAWLGARAVDEPLAFDAYAAALEREEGAATRYARLARRARRVTETVFARQSAESQSAYAG